MSRLGAPLTVPEIARLKAAMEALGERLRAQEEESAASRAAVTLDQQSVGRLSRMDALQQQAMAQAEQRRRGHDLARIEAAMGRIAAQDYGFCGECGEPIGVRRLTVDPMATRCIACAD